MGRDYDRDRYDRRDTSRSGLFERLEEAPIDRAPRETMDRAGYSPVRRPYDRGFAPEEPPVRDPAAAYGYADAPGNGNVTIMSPKSYMDVQDMIDKLRRNESIIVNLEGIENDSAQRILDFLSGAAYALGGSMRRVKEMHSTFLVTPQGTGITDTNDDRYPR